MCCPRGPKLIQDVIVCDVPCCPGLQEISTNLVPDMGAVIWCDNSEVRNVQKQPPCCTRCLKLIQDVIVCDAPCCPDLQEMSTNSMPHMGEFIWCQNPDVSFFSDDSVCPRSRERCIRIIGDKIRGGCKVSARFNALWTIQKNFWGHARLDPRQVPW